MSILGDADDVAGPNMPFRLRTLKALNGKIVKAQLTAVHPSSSGLTYEFPLMLIRAHVFVSHSEDLLRGAHAVVICTDVANEAIWNEVKTWLHQVSYSSSSCAMWR